jgi:Tfp pilus assembly protein PilV
MPLNNRRGATLIETLLATCLLIIVVVMISIALPKAAKSSAQTKMNWVASNLATSYLATLRSQPYDYVDPTNASVFGAGNPTCDCRSLDFSVLPSSQTQSAGTTYSLRSCIHYVVPGTGNVWTSRCSGDSGYKNIQVRVNWQVGLSTYTYNQEASISRT